MFFETLAALTYYIKAALRWFGLPTGRTRPKRPPLSAEARAAGVRRTRHGVIIPAGVEADIWTGELTDPTPERQMLEQMLKDGRMSAEARAAHIRRLRDGSFTLPQ